MKNLLRKYWPIIPAFLVYSGIAYKLNFIQDDAYISYRYVANFLNGDGLVYNIGERIEGFTNFGWVIYLILWGAIGADYILLSQVTGFLFGLGVLVLTFLIAQLVFEKKGKIYPLLAVMLAAFNLSLAYWSPAGLETAAFAFFTMLALYLFIIRSWWLVFAMLMAVWIRPDGVVVAGLLLIIEVIQSRQIPKFSLYCGLIAFALSIPFLVFKISYYGSIFPNPFYAKTGLNFEQLKNGWEYTWQFLKDYGFVGVGLIFPFAFFKQLSKAARTVWWAGLIFTVYLLFIGGDVLKVHRFFLPVIGVFAILSIQSLKYLTELVVSKPMARKLSFGVALGMMALTIYLPVDQVKYYNFYEKRFMRKMQAKAQFMKESDSTNFSVAVPTIGIFGYELLGHKIIDMVGLTDSTIARHSEEPIPGMQTTWKEAKHNSAYLLESAPDYITFSTDLKPSAPAERALLLYPQFIEGYRTRGWFYLSDQDDQVGNLIVAFKRVKEIKGPFEPTYPVQWVEYYKLGLDAYGRGEPQRAIALLEKSIKASPKPYYPYALYQMAFCYMQLNQHEKAKRLNDLILEMDSSVYEAHKDLYIYARFDGDSVAAEIHSRWLKKLVPWYFPRLKAIVEQKIAETNQTVR